MGRRTLTIQYSKAERGIIQIPARIDSFLLVIVVIVVEFVLVFFVVAGVFASVSMVMVSAENNQKLVLTNKGSGGWEYRQSMSLYSHNNQNCSSFHSNNLQLFFVSLEQFTIVLRFTRTIYNCSSFHSNNLQLFFVSLEQFTIVM